MTGDKKTFNNEFKNRLYTFAVKLIALIDRLPNDNVSRRIADQLLRSGTSILGNFIEGQSASSKKDLANFFNYSLKSSNESGLWLALLKDCKRLKQEDVTWFLQELSEYSKIFAASILTLKGKRR